jgi:hypothetical protein
MNDKLKTWLGIGIPGLAVLIAMYGKPFLEVMASVPALAAAWSSQLPLGLGSVFLALAVSMAAWAYAIHWLPDTKDGQRPQFAAATIAVLVAIAVTVAQQWGGKPSAVLNAVWMGFTAGVVAPWLANGIRSLLVSVQKP